MTGSTDAVSARVRRSRSRARPGSRPSPRCRDARTPGKGDRTPVGPGRDAVLLGLST
jgi:hypothetical protein